jgi:hypothetical protein
MSSKMSLVTSKPICDLGFTIYERQGWARCAGPAAFSPFTEKPAVTFLAPNLRPFPFGAQKFAVR